MARKSLLPTDDEGCPHAVGPVVFATTAAILGAELKKSICSASAVSGCRRVQYPRPVSTCQEEVKNTIFYQHRQLRFGMTAYEYTTSYKQASIDTSASRRALRPSGRWYKERAQKIPVRPHWCPLRWRVGGGPEYYMWGSRVGTRKSMVGIANSRISRRGLNHL